MAALQWDLAGKRFYETGVSKGVLYVMGDNGEYENGVAWNGLTGVTESPEGAEVSAIYADNIKYLNLISAEELKLTVEAYTYPDEFMACDGEYEMGTASGVFLSQQARKQFALCYQTKLGNDQNSELGYKIHIIYGCVASPSDRAYETVNDSPDAITFSWEVNTTPVLVTGFKPTSKVEIISTKANAEKLALIEKNLYGDTSSEPTLLLPDAIADLLK